jgi:HEAT repeat protein
MSEQIVGRPRDARVLVLWTAASDAARRRFAARSLGLIGDRQAVEPLKAAAADQDAEVTGDGRDR